MSSRTNYNQRMRLPFQWLVLPALAAVLCACPQTKPAEDSTASAAGSGGVIDTQTIEAQYNKNCSICHGAALEGRPGMAPALTAAKANWKSEAELTKYLADPQGYADKDARLGAQRDKYSMRMPAIPTMTDADRLAMARWILAK
jgi:mono/diheme cytochrome c family protein